MSQHMEALAKANHVRLARSQIKRDIKLGNCTVTDVLECMPHVCDRMSIYELLTSQRRWGRKRTIKLLSFYSLCGHTGIKEDKKLRSLTPHEKRYLVQKLSSHR